jgi:NADPH-dependent 2,4-dienoyl-CoA reductase/sulfur reductase-like enzyme
MTGNVKKASSESRTDTPAMDTDVIVIGSGPAGMSAAIELASSGCRVIVLDLQPAPGGQIFRGLEANAQARPVTDSLLAALGPTYRAGLKLIEQFRATPGIDYRPDTIVWDLRSDGTVGWLQEDHAGYLRAHRVVLANGAMERPTPFDGWTLPGVMTAGAVQTLIKAGRLRPEGRTVLVGTGPLIFLLADQLRRLGVQPLLIARTDRFRDKVAALARIRPAALPALLKGIGWLARLRLSGIPMRSGVSGLKAYGKDRLERISMTVKGRTTELPCDLLVVHDGIVPATDVAHCAGLALEWREAEASWRPVTSEDGRASISPGPALTSGPCRISIAGDARLIGGADAAIAHGRHVAKAIVIELDKVSADTRMDLRQSAAEFRRKMAGRPFLDKAFPLGLAADLPDDSTIICRCEEITAGSLREQIRAGASDMNHIRGLMRCGMGPCQGRTCSATLARLLKEQYTQSAAPPVPFRARPPLRPLPLGALAALTGLDPELAQVISLQDKPDNAIGAGSHG